ncbi:MAG: hypothetical protein M1580_01540 [Candidatus Parvarchaeota archaeon]|nr:hypothetical protein [Candidatus Parvarchaeota archaeon]
MDKEQGDITYIFTYLLSWLSGIIVFVTKGQNDKRMKFHSLQAIFLGIIAIVLDFVLFFILYLGPLVAFLIWAYGMYIAVKAYEGEDVKIPFIADYSAKYSGYTPKNAMPSQKNKI